MVEDTETLTDALRREVLEETGLAVTGYEFFGTFTDPTRIVSYADGNVFRLASVAYRVHVSSFDELRQGPESEQLHFFSRGALAELDPPATQRPIVECLLSDEPPPHLE